MKRGHRSARATTLIALTTLGVLLLCSCAFALDPSLDVSQYAHTSWKVREGFTKGPITSIAQTPDGYLWLGTEFGLVRNLAWFALTECGPPRGNPRRVSSSPTTTSKDYWWPKTGRCGSAPGKASPV